MNNVISSFIKRLLKEARKQKEGKYKAEDVAEEVGICVQGLYKWYAKKDDEWNLGALMKLSNIFDFEVRIKGDVVEIMKNKNIEEIEEMYISNENNEVYSIYKDLGEYSIINLYTPSGNLSDDDLPELIEETFVFATPEECVNLCQNEKAVQVFGLLDNSKNQIINEKIIDIHPYKAENYYYFHLAPVIDKTIDGYDIVREYPEINIKLVKAFANLDIINDRVIINGYSNTYSDDYDWLGFALLPMNSNSSEDFITWYQTLELLYFSGFAFDNYKIDKRYFDRNKNEIFEGDILVKKGLLDYLYNNAKGLGLDVEEDNPLDIDILDVNSSNVNEYFKKYETVRVKKFSRDLYFNLNGYDYSLDKLKLEVWEKIEV